LTETLLAHAVLVRLSAFTGVFAAMALWELLLQPFRDDDRLYPLGRREPAA
jgi:hypothetical protein